MRILFDHNTPKPLRRYLAGHIVRTAREHGWDRIANGALIERAEEAGYDVLITADQGIPHQQTMTGLRLSLIVVHGPGWPYSERRIDAIRAALNGIEPGDVREVAI